MAEAFGIFPEEIWFKIVDHLEDYDDMLNLSKVFPELDSLLRKRKRFGLFEKILPHITEWMGVKALLRCWLVSKEWSVGVNKFLLDHPSIRAYHHIPEGTVQSSSSSEYSKCYYSQKFEFLRHYLQGNHIFSDIHSFSTREYLRKRQNHPPERSPFLGRSIEINPALDSGDPSCQKFWAEVLNFLRIWGEHIWFITVHANDRQTPRHFCQSVLSSLRLLPNLRGLNIAGRLKWFWDTSTFAYNNWTTSLGLEGARFPDLPYLETFHCSYQGLPHLAHAIVGRYASQIRRLQLELTTWSWGWVWKEEYSNLFPNLTELEITNIQIGEVDWKDKLPLRAPQLYRIQLKFADTQTCVTQLAPGDYPQPIYIGPRKILLTKGDILNWLKPFPNLVHFQLPSKLIHILEGKGNQLFPIISVKSLSIHDSSINPNFLLSFPQVECLQIYFGLFTCYWDRAREKKWLRDYFRNGHPLEFGELLPNLKSIILVDDFYGYRKQISLAEFDEYLEKARAN